MAVSVAKVGRVGCCIHWRVYKVKCLKEYKLLKYLMICVSAFVAAGLVSRSHFDYRSERLWIRSAYLSESGCGVLIELSGFGYVGKKRGRRSEPTYLNMKSWI